MKKILSLCFFLSHFFVVSAFNIQLGEKEDIGTPFENSSLQTLLAKSENSDKLIFIDCYTTWCGPCKKMSNTVFKDLEVIQYLKSKFWSLKIDLEEEGDGRLIYEKYKIRTFPTFLILDTKGNELGRFTGGCSSSDFMKQIQSILDKV